MEISTLHVKHYGKRLFVAAVLAMTALVLLALCGSALADASGTTNPDPSVWSTGSNYYTFTGTTGLGLKIGAVAPNGVTSGGLSIRACNHNNHLKVWTPGAYLHTPIPSNSVNVALNMPRGSSYSWQFRQMATGSDHSFTIHWFAN